jgi:hypothetical protein
MKRRVRRRRRRPCRRSARRAIRRRAQRCQPASVRRTSGCAGERRRKGRTHRLTECLARLRRSEAHVGQHRNLVWARLRSVRSLVARELDRRVDVYEGSAEVPNEAIE